MDARRRRLLAAGAGALAALAGCGGGGLTGPSTPPPSSFVVTADGPHAVVLRYTGIGTQQTDRFRVVLQGASEADGAYDLAAVTGDATWTPEDRYRLDRASLGLAEPLSVGGLTVELQYDDSGRWRTVLRANPAD